MDPEIVALARKREALIGEAQVAEWLGMGLSTLRALRAKGLGPAYVRIGLRRLAYRPADVEAYIADRTSQPTVAAG